MSFARAIATVGGLTMLSRVAGFARDVLTAAVLGAGPVADAFFVALKLPNFLRRLFAEGGFSVAFVPMFAAELQARGKAAALAFAEEALGAMLLALVPLTLAVVAAMPAIVPVLAPGFADEAGDGYGRFALAVELARLTFPYLLLVSLVALLGGVLNALERFGPFAAAPIAFNLTLMAALLAASPLGLDPARALAAGVTLAGMVQLVWLALHCRAAGAEVRLALPRPGPRITRLARLIGPGALGTGVMQVNLLVDVVIASLLPAGAISFLYYADRLNQLPLGVIGIAVGTALLPPLARHAAANERQAAAFLTSRGMETSLLLALPAAAGLMVLADPIIAVLFERGAFGAAEAHATALALAAYATGIPAYVAAKVLGTGFFARQDMGTPLRAGIAGAVANAGLGLALAPAWGHVGIALATGIAAWVNLALLALAQKRHGLPGLDERFRRRLPRIVAATAAMALAVALAARLGGMPDADAGKAARALALAGLVALGAACFLAAAHLLGAVRAAELRALLRRPEVPAR